MKKMHPAKKYLLQIQKYDALIENKKAEKVFWEDIATGTTMHISEDVYSSSGNKQKMANAVINILEIQQEINSYIKTLYEKRKEVTDVIEQLNADEYDLLHKVYIQYYSLKEVQYMKKKSYSSITFLHGRALNNVLKIIERNNNNE
jgi:ribosomal protein L20A (L18A)